jgi:acyl carrier protein
LSSHVQLRQFSSKVSPAPRIKEAVENFLNVRKSELQQYEAVDPSDKEETEKLIKVLEGAKVSPETTWASLGLDGLDEVELVLSIEESLGITLPDEEFHTVRSVSDAINVFSKYTAKQG